MGMASLILGKHYLALKFDGVAEHDFQASDGVKSPYQA